MPKPSIDESRESFMNRCIPTVISERTAHDIDQAIAICSSIWEEERSKETINYEQLKANFNLDAGNDNR